jgi:hypothetical protein
MALRTGYGFRLGGGVGVFFGGTGAIWVVLAIGSMRLAVALLFIALTSLVGLMRLAATLGAASPKGRRRLAEPYLRDAVSWDVEERLTAAGGARLWGVYGVGDSFFTGRHPARIGQLRTAYPDRADRVVAVAVFPSGEMARASARGLRRHGFSGEELLALLGKRAVPAAANELPLPTRV